MCKTGHRSLLRQHLNTIIRQFRCITRSRRLPTPEPARPSPRPSLPPLPLTTDLPPRHTRRPGIRSKLSLQCSLRPSRPVDRTTDEPGTRLTSDHTLPTLCSQRHMPTSIRRWLSRRQISRSICPSMLAGQRGTSLRTANATIHQGVRLGYFTTSARICPRLRKLVAIWAGLPFGNRSVRPARPRLLHTCRIGPPRPCPPRPVRAF